MIDPLWCFATYAPLIAALPDRLHEEDVARPELLLYRLGPLAIYYAPFDWVNAEALVTLVGITPGQHQMFLACQEAKRGLLAGLGYDEVLRKADTVASFAGVMRTNLVTMLDGIGLASALGIESAASLFGEHAALVESTSALCYPVFVHGQNYTGGSPALEVTSILRAFVEDVLAANLSMARRSLVIPLGKTAARAVEMLIVRGRIDPRRCLLDFPHPSGANGHRQRLYREHQQGLSEAVHGWFTGLAKA